LNVCSEEHAALLDEVVVEYYEPRHHAFHADTLLTVDWRQRDDDHRPGLELAAPRAALRRVREVMAPLAAEASLVEGSCDRHVIVWISRNKDRLSGKDSRSVLNEDEVLGAIKAFVKQRDGWELEVFYGDALDLDETVALFSRATVVMGVHGAGLVNMVYSREGTHVVEVALATPRHRDYMHMSVALGHRYWMLPAPEQALEAAITVNVEHIVGVLRRVAEGSALSVK
jgi:capsular polysaccharide biosynthesis protein